MEAGRGLKIDAALENGSAQVVRSSLHVKGTVWKLLSKIHRQTQTAPVGGRMRSSYHICPDETVYTQSQRFSTFGDLRHVLLQISDSVGPQWF